jgi:phage/plasmid primase-like uncharacterized protein
MQKSPYEKLAWIVGLSLFFGLAVLGWQIQSGRNDGTITVTGSVKEKVTADLAKWNANFSRRANLSDLPETLDRAGRDTDTIRQFIVHMGIPESAITFLPIQTDSIYESSQYGSSQTVIGYTVRQEVRVESGDIQKIDALATGAKGLVNLGVVPEYQRTEYFYTKLSEIRPRLFAEATKDARMRDKIIDKLVVENKLLPVKKEGLEKNTYTTADLLSKETAIIQMMIDGKNKYGSITSNLSKYSRELSGLNDGQKRSAELILTSKDMVTGIQGFAGVGKTFMLSTVNQIAKTEGYQFIGLSPTGVATRNLTKAANIELMTLQRFLMKYDGVAMGRGTQQGRVKMREEFKDKIVVVDESSMISTVQMKNLLTISSELNFRLVLVGDRRQLDSVEAGVPFYEMQRNGMPFADMREIIRQKNPQLKSAVYSTIKRDIDQAFKEIEYDVFETKDVAGLAVKKFIELPLIQRKNSIILTPANETREKVNDEVSRIIYEERIKQSQGKEYIQEIYQNKNLSEAEKTRAYRFRAGDIILFSKDRDFIGVKKNSYCEITKVDTKQNLITVKLGLFRTQTFDPLKLKGKAAKNYFEVFSKAERIFREGDKIAFNRSIPELKIINSDGAVLTKINRLNIYLKLDSTGKEIKIKKNSLEARYLDYSYAVTAHKAQGLTCQNVIAVCESNRNNLTSQKNFYVEISRAQERAIVITDSKQEVIEKLKANTGVEISARDHQNIPHLGVNMIKSTSKPQFENKPIEKKHFITNYTQYEIKNHFIEAIKSTIKLDAPDIANAVEESLKNKSNKIRFGQKKEYEICWHGEAGYIKNYKTGEYFDWGLNSIKEEKKLIEISKEDMIKNQEFNKKIKAEQEKKRIIEERKIAANAKKYFEGFLKPSILNTMQNKYLQRKGINQKIVNGIKYTKDDKLVIPLYDTKGDLHSLQFIDQSGKKTFLKGGKKQGNFFMIDAEKIKDSKEIYLAEGFATAASVNLATNKPVAVTFDAGNIEHVLKNLKETHPNKEFKIAADNDLWKEHNMGREKAELAAQKYGAKVILPNFTPDHKNELPTDFNDLHKLSGLAEVQRQLETHQITHEHNLHH